MPPAPLKRKENHPKGRPKLRVTKAASTRVGEEETSIHVPYGRGEAELLVQDWADTTFSTVKLCSKMSRQDAQDLKNMKRVGRFLIGKAAGWVLV